MKTNEFAVLLAYICLLCLPTSIAKHSPPMIQVYSRRPGLFGKENTLICHVSGFHPPEISVKLLRNGQEMPGAVQTDLAFEESWHYHITKHVHFTPQEREQFACNVTHVGRPRIINWEADM